MDGLEALALCTALLVLVGRFPHRDDEDFGGRLIDELEGIRTRLARRPEERDLRRLLEIELTVEKWPAED